MNDISLSFIDSIDSFFNEIAIVKQYIMIYPNFILSLINNDDSVSLLEIFNKNISNQNNPNCCLLPCDSNDTEYSVYGSLRFCKTHDNLGKCHESRHYYNNHRLITLLYCYDHIVVLL